MGVKVNAGKIYRGSNFRYYGIAEYFIFNYIDNYIDNIKLFNYIDNYIDNIKIRIWA